MKGDTAEGIQMSKHCSPGHTVKSCMTVIERWSATVEIKRVYYMYDTLEGVRRGFHAHKCLEQILICIHGSCKILMDDGNEKVEVPLDKPYEGLYISNAIWREMFDFSPDAVLMVLASEYYDESDYIRNYDEFLKYIGKK